MAAVEPDGVTDAEPLHAPGKIRVARLDQKMEMILHQHIGVHAPAETLHRLSEQGAKMLVIPRVAVDGLTFVAARGEMIPGTCAFDSQRACHMEEAFTPSDAGCQMLYVEI